MSNRLDNTRVVTFKEDYVVNKRVIYKGGSEHAIHKDLAEKLKKKGASVSIKEFDTKKKVAEAKEKLAEAEKKEAK